MKYFKYLWISLLSLSLMMSCQPMTAEEKAVQDLVAQAEQHLEKIQKVDMTQLQKTRDEAKALEKKMGTYFANLKGEALSTLSELANTTKAFRKSHFEPKDFNKEYQHNIKQLQSLLEDFKHKAISKEQFEKYLQDEKKAMDLLNQKTEAALSTILFVEKSYQRIMPKARHLGDSLQ